METEQEDFFTGSREAFKSYLNNRVWLLKLQAGEKAGRVSGMLAVFFMLCLLGFFTIFFLSIMAGLWLSAYTQSFAVGFSIVAGLYVLLILVLILARKKIMAWVGDKVVAVLFSPEKDMPDENE